VQSANSTQNKIDPFSLTLPEMVELFREFEYTDFQQFQRELYSGELEVYWEEENEEGESNV